MPFEFFRRQDPDKIRFVKRRKLKITPVGPEGPTGDWPDGFSKDKPIKAATKKERVEAAKKVADEERRVGHPDE